MPRDSGSPFRSQIPCWPVLVEPTWASRLTDEDRRGLTALFWSNVNPYGTFRLDMDKRLAWGSWCSDPKPRRRPSPI
ncbi:hypothetical protein GCM10010302_16840 [Streptomyces polychromogenes]|uniref:Transposase n=1 Tax=Streptomyces polychromogenes TaxID=67342 RepID=A0ABN0V852_9ACTN